MSKKELIYNNEPPRANYFQVNAATPFNAEPPNELLVKSFLTPNETFFVRNHGPVPVVDEKSYVLKIEGLVNNQISLSLKDLKEKFAKKEIVAALQCAGNRRNELSDVKKVKGVGWGIGAVSNAAWGGVLLSDVLQLAGVQSQARHVAFESIEPVVEDKLYGSSVPIEKAIDRAGDVLLAYEMNGVELPRDHGYPLRVVVPGHIGARSVKWLARIIVQQDESPNFFQQRDYRLFVPQVDTPTPEQWASSWSLQEYPVQSAILEPRNGDVVGNSVTVRGYALSGGGRRVERVDVSIDEGKTWHTARLFGETKPGKVWSWCLWHIVFNNIPSPCTIICKAWDSAAQTQSQEAAHIWNTRGLLNNSWHKVVVNTTKAKM